MALLLTQAIGRLLSSKGSQSAVTDGRLRDGVNGVASTLHAGIPFSDLAVVVDLLELLRTSLPTRNRSDTPPTDVTHAICGLIAVTQKPFIAVTQRDGEVYEASVRRLTAGLLRYAAVEGTGAAATRALKLLSLGSAGDVVARAADPPLLKALLEAAQHASPDKPGQAVRPDVAELIVSLCHAHAGVATRLLAAGIAQSLVGSLEKGLESGLADDALGLLLALASSAQQDRLHVVPGSPPADVGGSCGDEAPAAIGGSLLHSVLADPGQQGRLLDALTAMLSSASQHASAYSRSIRSNALALLLLLLEGGPQVSLLPRPQTLVAALRRVCATRPLGNGVAAQGPQLRGGGTAMLASFPVLSIPGCEHDCEAVLMAWHLLARLVLAGKPERGMTPRSATSRLRARCDPAQLPQAAAEPLLLCLRQYLTHLAAEWAAEDSSRGASQEATADVPSGMGSWSEDEWRRLATAAMELLSQLCDPYAPLLVQEGLPEICCEIISLLASRMGLGSVYGAEVTSSTHSGGAAGLATGSTTTLLMATTPAGGWGASQKHVGVTLGAALSLLAVLCHSSNRHSPTPAVHLRACQVLLPLHRRADATAANAAADAEAVSWPTRAGAAAASLAGRAMPGFNSDQPVLVEQGAVPSAGEVALQSGVVPVLVALLHAGVLAFSTDPQDASAVSTAHTHPIPSSTPAATSTSRPRRRSTYRERAPSPSHVATHADVPCIAPSLLIEAALAVLSQLPMGRMPNVLTPRAWQEEGTEDYSATVDFLECGGVEALATLLHRLLAPPSNAPRLLVACLGALRSAVLPDEDCVEEFAAQDGVGMLWDLVAAASMSTRGALFPALSLLADLCHLHEAARFSSLQWRSQGTNTTAIDVLLQLWRDARNLALDGAPVAAAVGASSQPGCYRGDPRVRESVDAQERVHAVLSALLGSQAGQQEAGGPSFSFEPAAAAGTTGRQAKSQDVGSLAAAEEANSRRQAASAPDQLAQALAFPDSCVQTAWEWVALRLQQSQVHPVKQDAEALRMVLEAAEAQ